MALFNSLSKLKSLCLALLLPLSASAQTYDYSQYANGYTFLAKAPSQPSVHQSNSFEHELVPTPGLPSVGASCGGESGTTCAPMADSSQGPPGPRCFAPCCQCRPQPLWYASAAGLYLDRSEPTRVWTTYESGVNANQLMNTQDADTDWEGGAEFRLGRTFCCNRWAVELGYWTVDNFTGYASQTHPSNVSSPLLFNDLEFPTGLGTVAFYFDTAEEHRLRRTNELHNFEANVIQGCCANGCRRWSSRMLAGFRFFRFDEDLVFETLDAGGTWGGSGGIDEVRLSDSVRNSLFGAQLGCVLTRQCGRRTQLVLSPKFGIYNNHIENRFDLRRGDGTAAIPSAGSGITGSYPVESETDEVAFLSEATAGLQYQLSRRCTLVGGYRVVVLSNIALSDEQIPQYIIDIPEINDIVTTGSLVLHGGYFGATWCF